MTYNEHFHLLSVAADNFAAAYLECFARGLAFVANYLLFVAGLFSAKASRLRRGEA